MLLLTLSIKEAFEGKNMQSDYYVLGCRTDIFLHDYKFAIEVDELGDKDSDINYEIESKKAIEKKLDC